MLADVILAGCGVGFAVVGIIGAIQGDANDAPASVVIGFLLWVMGVGIVLLALRGMA